MEHLGQDEMHCCFCDSLVACVIIMSSQPACLPDGAAMHPWPNASKKQLLYVKARWLHRLWLL